MLKILWVLDVIVLIVIIAGIVLEKPEKGIFVYVILYLGLIAVSIYVRNSNPKLALIFASIPVAIPILIVLFFAIVFNIASIVKYKMWRTYLVA